MSFLLPAFVFVVALFAMMALDYDHAWQPRRPYGDVYGAAWVASDGEVYHPPSRPRVVAYRLL